MTRPVVAICVGAQKCGTSSLHEYVARLEIPIIPEKEHKAWLGYDPIISWDEFEYAVNEALNDSGLFVEIDPDLCLFPGAIRKIAAIRPDASIRLLFIYRDPVERMISQYRMELRRGFETRSFQDAIQSADSIRKPTNALRAIHFSYAVRSSYMRLVTDAVRSLDATLTVISMSSLIDSPREAMTAWIPESVECLSKAPCIADTFPHRNEAGRPIAPRLSRWLHAEPFAVRLGKRLLGRGSSAAQFFRRFRQWVDTARDEFECDLSDLERARSLVEEDWRAFQQLADSTTTRSSEVLGE